DDLDDLGMVRLAKEPKCSGKIARADKHAVDALDARNGFEVLKPAPRLDLHEETNLGVRRGMVSLDPAIPRRARLPRVAAKPLRRIAGGHHRALRFFLRLDIGDEKRLGADVEQALDDDGIVPGGPDHGMRRSAAHRL